MRYIIAKNSGCTTHDREGVKVEDLHLGNRVYRVHQPGSIGTISSFGTTRRTTRGRKRFLKFVNVIIGTGKHSRRIVTWNRADVRLAS
jgi:hypothetical protein